jgi:hypothetical protein
VGCPKLDEVDFYTEKLTEILKRNEIKSVTIAHMEVPCCFGLRKLVSDAAHASGKSMPIKTSIIGVQGDIKEAS